MFTYILYVYIVLLAHNINKQDKIIIINIFYVDNFYSN